MLSKRPSQTPVGSIMRTGIGRPIVTTAMVFVVLLLSHTALYGADVSPGTVVPKGTLIHADDYTFGYYPEGWRLPQLNAPIKFAVQTNRYGLLFNASQARIEKLGPIEHVLPADEALREGNDLFERLPGAALTFSVQWNNRSYPAALGAGAPDQVRLYHVGKYLQHFDLQTVQIGGGPTGAGLAGVSAWIGGYCWSDRLAFQMHLALYENHLMPAQKLDNVRCAAALTIPDAYPIVEALGADDRWREMKPGDESSQAVLMRNAAGSGVAFVCAPRENQRIMFTEDNRLVVESPVFSLREEKTVTFPCIVVPSRDVRLDARREAHTMQLAVDTTALVSAEAITPYTGALDVLYDPAKGWHQIMLGVNPDKWKMERVRLNLTNPGNEPCTIRLNLAKIGGPFSITGMSPVLRDAEGYPIGLPVQISKNWHISPTWFNGLAMLDLEPGQNLNLEFTLVYSHWGGVPPVSHAQLCLVGYAKNQLWDEMAIGSFGESICYDPDVNLGRSMVDDMRPLMVWAMGNRPNTKWNWTHNLGGCDFLTLYMKSGEERKLLDRTDTTLFSEGSRDRTYLVRQKTLYDSYCPVISDVRYAGETPGGEIQSHIRTQSWRSDDYVRALYTMRYEVKKPLENFDRLAFFQLGADNYNWLIFSEVARGTIDGLVETWKAPLGGLTYSRRGEELPGKFPWFAFYGVKKEPKEVIRETDQGAMGNKGMIVRQWKARLGGKACPLPCYSVFGSMDYTAKGLKGYPDGLPGALIELSPPKGVTRLEPGDFVEAQVEVLILPQKSEDYYGPNNNLIAALKAQPDSWNLVHREAVGSDLAVTASTGTVEQRYPVRIRAAEGKRAEFTITGGVGYTPVIITGVSAYRPFTLRKVGEDGTADIIDESSEHGNDWWQTDFNAATGEWEITYTLSLDAAGDKRVPHRFVWSLDTLDE